MRKMTTIAAGAALLASMAALAPPARAQAVCNNGSLTGPYAVKLDGFLGRIAVAGAGQVTTDGNGAITTGVITLSKNGFVRQALSLTGTYSVNGNCTGVMTLNVTGFQPENFQIVLSGGGTGFFGVQADFQTTITLTAKQ